MMNFVSYEFQHGNGTKITIINIPDNLPPLTAFFNVQVFTDEVLKIGQPRNTYSFYEFWSKCGTSNPVREDFL